VPIPHLDPSGGELRFTGLGLRGLRTPDGPLDLENSGTGARLLLGVLAGQPLEVVLTGDESLRSRPMARVTDPLSDMGARFEALEAEGRLPIRVWGGDLAPLSYRLPVASAQLKSALLLAGLVGGVEVRLVEPGRSRDHTERMFNGSGVPVVSGPETEGWGVFLPEPPAVLDALDMDIPGDFSSAAFAILLGLLGPGPEPLVLRGVGLNETRTRLLPVLERMGARVGVENLRGDPPGEAMGDLVIRPSSLRGCAVGGDEIPGLIDEVPILAAGATRAQGTTKITGAGELRVKETDRIRAMVENLRALGVEAEELPDGLEVEGSDRPLRGTVRSFGDHRIAMAFGILGALPGNEIEVLGSEVVGVSFPDFWGFLAEASRGWARGGGGGPSSVPTVVTLDGPAGSGKSTTAREVARRLGYRHLDSGALYRALTYALIQAGIPEDDWSHLSQEELDRFPIHLEPEGNRLRVMLGDRVLAKELRTPEVTERVSPLSALPAVRAWLLEAQRRAGQVGGLVADGRDMGSVVFPEARVKIFLTANLRERARRRFLERDQRDPSPQELEEEASKIQERDARDSGRAVAPLKKPEGALEVDTSDMTFEGQVEVIIHHVKLLTEK
jgi:3-phosphoshikimate 1-carboxyvinyltransferase